MKARRLEFEITHESAETRAATAIQAAWRGWTRRLEFAPPVGGGHRANPARDARRGDARKKRARKRFRAKRPISRAKCVARQPSPLARALQRASYPGRGCGNDGGRGASRSASLLACPPPPPWRPPRTARRRTRRREARETPTRVGDAGRTPRLERVPGSVPLRRGFRRGPPGSAERARDAGFAAAARATRSAALGPWVTCAALSRRSRGRRAPPPARARRHPPRAPCARSCASCAGATGATRTNPYCAWPTTCSRRCRATKPGRRAPCSRRRMPWWRSPSTCRCAATASHSWAPPRARSRTCAATRGARRRWRAPSAGAPRAACRASAILGNTARRGGTAAGARARVARRHATASRDAEPARAGGHRAEHA